ncbi:hypothetical protein [Micromonospora sp. LOL_023]|uniref:hypothetical protein n=1 Tax=Micromonospora sp. LOL_023 TaxID=3345418 RepID=UPI003A88258E
MAHRLGPYAVRSTGWEIRVRRRRDRLAGPPELGFFGSVWHPEGYEDVPALIRDYHGRPTLYGAGVKDRRRH